MDCMNERREMKKKLYVPMSRFEYIMRHFGKTPDIYVECPGDWWEEWLSKLRGTCQYSLGCPESENCWSKPAVIKGRYIMKRVKQRSDLK